MEHLEVTYKMLKFKRICWNWRKWLIKINSSTTTMQIW